MNKIEIFRNPEFGEIETIIIDGNPYFKAIDVCKCLGYVRHRNAIKRHVHSEDTLSRGSLSKGGEQQTIFINESGLYSLVMRSNLKDAMTFQRWVTSDLLPTLRKTGRYELEQKVIEGEAHNKHLLQRIKEAEQDAAESKNLLSIAKGLHISDQVSEVRLFTTTEVADMVDMSAQQLNKRLEDMGIQKKDYGIWMLTDKFKPYGYAAIDISHINNRYKGYRMKKELMKWTEAGVRFIVAMITGIDDVEIDKMDLTSHKQEQRRINSQT